MLFSLLLIAIIAAVTFIHYIQGLFSATISAILAIFAAVLAVSYHEWIVEALLGGKMADSAHAMVLVVLFAAIYIIPRVAFDQLVPGNVRVPPMADKLGGAAMGLIAGVFGAGVVALAAQEMPFMPSLWGYARYAVEPTKELNIRLTGGREAPPMNDVLTVPGFEDPVDRAKAPDQGMKNGLMVPVDDVLVNTVRTLSNGGSLAGSQPLEQIHPDWLAELFAQRMGIEPGAKRVAFNTAKRTQVSFSGVYKLDPITIAQREGEPKLFHYQPRPWPVKFADANRVLVAIRVIFGSDAADPDGIIRFSPGSVRLVTQAPSAQNDQGMQYVDYFPIGTLDDAHYLYLSMTDDFLFLSQRAENRLDPVTAKEVKIDGSRDRGADFVFWVQAKGFLDSPSVKPGQTAPQKVTPGTFLEVKRMARLSLAGQDLKQPLPPSDQIAVVRKADAIMGPTTGPSIPTTMPTTMRVTRPGIPPVAPSGTAAPARPTTLPAALK